MLVRAAEESFEKGLLALGENRWREAMAYFESAVALERRFEVENPQARYLSYLGLCLGMTRTKTFDAIQLCHQAVTLERYNADIRWNLGRVLLAAGKRREAYSAFVRGLRQEPDHSGLRCELRRMGMRRRPVIAFLSRTHPINVMFGRMRVPR